MSDGKWSGGAANRTWVRPGSRRSMTPEDAERGHRLYEQMAGVSFLCETCGQMHPLVEHQRCREVEAGRPNALPLARA